MLQYGNHSECLVVLLHEIYGINRHIKLAGRRLAERGFAVAVPELLAGAPVFAYEEEQAAYRHFREKVGFEAAAERVKGVLATFRNEYRRVFVLGYSVGATVAWLCADSGLCDAVAGYYGSRIRDYAAIEPACPTLLLLPAGETAFDVAWLTGVLAEKRLVVTTVFGGRHGFADPFSPHFDEQSAAAACDKLASFFHSQAGRS